MRPRFSLARGLVGLALAGLAPACFQDHFADVNTSSGTGASATSSGASSGGVSTGGGASSGHGSAAATTTTTSTTTSSASTSTSTSGGATGSTGIPAGPGCTPAPTLVACYDFDGPWSDATLPDRSGHGLDGSLVGVAETTGHEGGAAATTANSTILVPSDPALASEPAWTQMIWIRPDALPAGTARWGLIDRQADYGIFVHATSGVQCKTGSGISLDSGFTPAIGAWTHLACVRRPEAVDLRVNGEVVSTLALTGHTPVPEGGLVIANDAPTPTPDQAFLGAIDDVMIWRASLTKAELCAAAGLTC